MNQQPGQRITHDECKNNNNRMSCPDHRDNWLISFTSFGDHPVPQTYKTNHNIESLQTNIRHQPVIRKTFPGDTCTTDNAEEPAQWLFITCKNDIDNAGEKPHPLYGVLMSYLFGQDT